MDYTQQELLFLINNYPKYGAAYCAKHISRNKDAITSKMNKMRIRRIGREKHVSMTNILIDQFYAVTKPEVAYFLGYLWADGYIISGIHKQGQRFFKVSLEIVTDDANDISEIIDCMGKWAKNKRKRKETWKETTIISTNSEKLYSLLESLDFGIKSLSEPTKVLAHIPENLHCCFWRGFFDGDGCLSFNFEKYSNSCLKFSGRFEYKWLELTKLMDNLKIDGYSILVENNGKWKSSKCVIQNRNDIKTFISFLFLCNIGLKRKTVKLQAYLDSLR